MLNRYLLIREAGLRADQRLALACLQGLLNRTEPRMLVVRHPQDEHWADWYLRYGYEPEEIGWAKIGGLLSWACQGAVLVDPALPATLGVAVTACAARELLPWSPALAAEHPEVPVKLELGGRWPDKLSVYHWAYQELWPSCTRDTLASVHISGGEWPGAPILDFAVARRAFTTNLVVNDVDFPEEAAFWQGIMAQASPLALAVGWHQPEDIEATYVQACSQAGLVQVCSSGAGNLSFHRHLRARQPFRQDHLEQAELDPDAVYLTFTQTDGDSIVAMTNLQQQQWASPLRGTIPLGWWMAPRLADDLGPALLEYYYETKGPQDYLLCGPSGAGYNYLSQFRDREGYLALTRRYLQAVDLRALMVINRVVQRLPGRAVAHRTAAGEVPLPLDERGGLVEQDKNEHGADWVDPGVVADYAAALPQVLGFFQGFEPVVGEEHRFVGEIPWIPTQVMVDGPAQAMADIERCLAGRPRPAFVSATVNMCGPMVRRMFEQLSQLMVMLEARGYRVVRPDVFLALRREAHRELGV